MQWDPIGFITYLIGFIGWFGMWWIVKGYSLMKRYPLLHVPFWAAQVTFLVNAFLALFAPIPAHDVEMGIYAYVESNAKTVATLALAISVFVVLRMRKRGLQKDAYAFIWMILWSFLLSVLGVLPLFWMPARLGWLTALRHFKSVPFFYSLYILAAGVIVFISSMKKPKGL